MYTEIKELVNFFARYFHLRLPRLKIGYFCEHLANNCLLHFQPFWNINQPKQYEDLRILQISGQHIHQAFRDATAAVGLSLAEVISLVPENLTIYANPGEVYYCHSEYSPPIPIWLGSVSEDLNYEDTQVQPSKGTVAPRALPSAVLQQIHSPQQDMRHHGIQPLIGLPAAGFNSIDWRVPLALVKPSELGHEFKPVDSFLMFRFVVPNTPSFTVETFAATRFGSYRKRPDPKHTLRLQHNLAHFNGRCSEPPRRPSKGHHSSK